MPDLTSTADLIASLATRQQAFTFTKLSPATAIGVTASHWLGVGRPGAGATPGAAAVPTKDTPGALAKFTNPGATHTCRLIEIDCLAMNAPTAQYLYDRLVHMGGLSGTNVGAQTVSTPAITRGDTDGVGVVAFVEGYVVLGSTPQTLSVSYTNTAGTAGRTGTATIPASLAASRLMPIALQAGDRGFKSIETVTLSGSTGTPGNFGITLARRIKPIPCGVAGTSNTMILRSGLKYGLAKVESDACLWLILKTLGSGSGGAVRGGLKLITTG